jgi:hypothetical protein
MSVPPSTSNDRNGRVESAAGMPPNICAGRYRKVFAGEAD